MKPIQSLIRDNVKKLKPCVHGAEVLDASEQSGLPPQDIYDFSSSVNPLGPSKKALDAAKTAFSQIAAYPDSNSNGLRQVIANHYGISKDNIIVGNGSTELMYLFADVFLRDGDKVVMAAPTFGEYESAVRKAGVEPEFVKLNKDFNIDLEAFKLKMADAKLVFLCNPNNPTSKLISKQTLTDLLETALDKSTLVFLDEDFLEFVENEKALTLIGKIHRYPNLFILRSFTKIYGLTGLRVGYGIANEEIIKVLSCAKIPWNVNCLAQAAAVVALNDEEHLNLTRGLIQQEKAWLQRELRKFVSLELSVPDANFFFIDIRKSGLEASAIKSRMLKQGFLIRDCSSFNGLDQYYIRVAVKTHEENSRLIKAFKQILGVV
jgi:threonine-phosphate decarboxylase